MSTKVRVPHVVLAMAVAVLVCPMVMADPIFQADFEVAEGYPDASGGWVDIHGNKGWVVDSQAQQYSEVVTQAWAGKNGSQALWLRSPSGGAKTPVFDTSAQSNVSITFNMRPANLVTSSTVYGGLVYFYDNAGSIITRIQLQGSDTAHQGAVECFSGSTEIDSGLDWAYVDANTTLSFKMELDQLNRTWTLELNGQKVATATDRAWQNGATGTLSTIKFQGGYSSGGPAMFDTINVVPEPATTAMLLTVSAGIMASKRR